MATIDDVATNEQIQAIADGIRRVTRTNTQMTIPEMPGRLLQIRVIEVQKLSVTLTGSVNLGEYDTDLSHLFIAVPETSADAQKLSDAEPELKLDYTNGELTMTCNVATEEEISILVADCLLAGDSDSYGFLISSGGATAGAKPYDSTKAYKAGEPFFYDGKYQVTAVAHDAEQYTAAHNTILATSVDIASVTQGLSTHTSDKNNPHEVTAAQVGAYTTGQVDAKEAALNDAIALKEDKSNKVTSFDAQSTDTQYPSAKSVYAKAKDLGDSITDVDHKADANASDIDALEGTVAGKAAASDLAAHEADKANPHETTAAQVGAYTKSEADALLAAKENASNKSQVLNENSTHAQYPTSKTVYDRFKTDEETLSQHGTQLAGLGTAATRNTGTTSGTIPVLDSQGKLPQTVIPSAFLVTTYVVDTLQQMTQLPASQGNICVVNDESQTYILQHEPASVLANWVELKSPTDAVSSVNGQVGVVVLASTDLDDATTLWNAINGKVAQSVYDLFAASVNAHMSNTNNPHSVTKAQVGLSNVDNTSDENKPVSTAQQLALDAKVDKEHKTGSDVYYKVLSDNNFADADKQNLDANTAARHTHSNKAILDGTTASYTTAEKTKLGGIEEGAQANTVDSVNGKTGDVVLDYEDVGADAAGSAESLVGAHELDADAHKALFDALDEAKVDKETGKGLSTNDFDDTYKGNVDANTTARHTHSNKSILDQIEEAFTTALKTKLDGIAAGAEVNVQSDWNQSNSAADDYIKNKPSIPAKVSDLTNDLDFRTGAQVTSTAQSEAASAVSTHNSSGSAHSDIREAVSAATTLAQEAKAIAQGRVRAVSKDTLHTAVNYVAGLQVSQLGAGDTVFILETDVPDLWVYEADTTYVQYTWVDNDTFKAALDQYGYVQVGYYKLAMMESQKVDLTNYVQTSLKINGHALTGDVTLTASDVGADASGTAASAVSTHNSANDAHSILFANKVDKAYKTGSSTVYKVLSDNNFSDTDKSNLDSNTAARHSHSNKALLDTYTQTETNLADAVTKKHSHSNLADLENVVLFTAQSLSSAQQEQVRTNIGAGTSNFSGSYNDLTDKPTIPTDTNQKVKAGTTTFGDDDVVEFEAGTGIVLTPDAQNKKITVATDKVIPTTTDSVTSGSTAALTSGGAYTALSAKVDGFTKSISTSGGTPQADKFITVDYTTTGSEKGVLIKLSMVSGHGNGSSYAFLQDVILSVNYLGGVSAKVYKYYGADATYDSTAHQFGDIFYTIDTTNKIVQFYVLLGQYATLKMTPYSRLNSSNGGTITQHTGSAVQYSSGTKNWGTTGDLGVLKNGSTRPTFNGSGLAFYSEIPDISTKANDSAVVHNTTDETVAGKKTFTGQMTISADLYVNGNIYNQGTSYETHSEHLYVKDQVIWLRDQGSGAMSNYAGVIANLYDGTNSGGIIFDSNGIARVGDIAQDASGNILKGDTQAVATRQDSPSSYGVAYWNASLLRFDTLAPGTAGKALVSAGTSSAPTWTELVTLNTAQTISGAKTFTGTVIVPDVTIS